MKKILFFTFTIILFSLSTSLNAGNTKAEIDKKETNEEKQLVKNKIIVFNFKNISHSTEFDYLSEAFPSSIVTALLNTEDFIIIRNAEWKNKLKEQEISIEDFIASDKALELACSMGADAYVNGSFIHIGDTIRVNTTIINTETGNAEGGSSAEGKTGREVFDLIDDISEKLTEQLQKNFGPELQKIVEIEKIIEREKIVEKKIYIKSKKSKKTKLSKEPTDKQRIAVKNYLKKIDKKYKNKTTKYAFMINQNLLKARKDLSYAVKLAKYIKFRRVGFRLLIPGLISGIGGSGLYGFSYVWFYLFATGVTIPLYAISLSLMGVGGIITLIAIITGSNGTIKLKKSAELKVSYIDSQVVTGNCLTNDFKNRDFSYQWIGYEFKF